MQDTTRPTVVVLESIQPELLFGVNGGCKKAAPPPAPPAPAPVAGPIIQMLQMAPPAQPAPQPQLMAPPAPPMSYGPEVSTSVSINGQPA
jgi:hypothetical protein